MTVFQHDLNHPQEPCAVASVDGTLSMSESTSDVMLACSSWFRRVRAMSTYILDIIAIDTRAKLKTGHRTLTFHLE